MKIIAFLAPTFRIEIPEERLSIEIFRSCHVITGRARPLIRATHA